MDSKEMCAILRGEMIMKCKCHAYGRSECGCSEVAWPEDVAVEAAARIADLEAENARLEARVKRLVELLNRTHPYVTSVACRQPIEQDREHDYQLAADIDAALKEPQQ